jgi:alkylhydroperoxidase family enzyme
VDDIAPTPRIEPLTAPFAPAVEGTLRRLMGGHDAEPLSLFRTIARHDALLERFRQTGSTLLSFGRLDAADRETVIHRVTARCGCEYEWGVHAALFAPAAGLSDEWVAATVHGDHDDPAFTPRQALLVRLVDSLHSSSDVGDELWADIAEEWNEEEILELLALNGFYHLVSFVANGARTEPEPWARSFPASRAAVAPGS